MPDWHFKFVESCTDSTVQGRLASFANGGYDTDKCPQNGKATMSQLELSILEYLGGSKLLGISAPRTPFVFHELVSIGLPARSATFFKESSGFTNIELSRLLGISEKTFIRWQGTPKKPIDPVVSDRLYRTAKILALAAEVIEDKDAARAWLSEAQFGLGNKTPGELLTTDAGARQVEDLLLRMEHGYLA